MNAGIWMQVKADKAYAGMTDFGLKGREQQSSVSFMDVFTSNLKDSLGNGASGARTSAGKQQDILAQKARDSKDRPGQTAQAGHGTQTVHGQQTTHGKKEAHGSQTANGTQADEKGAQRPDDGQGTISAKPDYRDDRAEAGTADGLTDRGESTQDSGKEDTGNRKDGRLNPDAAGMLAMMALWQNGAADGQTAAGMQAQMTDHMENMALQAGTDGQMMPSQAGLPGSADTAQLVNMVQSADVGQAAMAQQAADGKQTAGTADFRLDTAESVRNAPDAEAITGEHGMTAAGTADGQAAAARGYGEMQQEPGSDGGSDMAGGLYGRKAAGADCAGADSTGADRAQEEPGEANQILEELRRNAQAGGLDMSDRMVQNRLGRSVGFNEALKEQQVQTPVPQQLKAGLAQGMKAGLKDFTVHLKPEGLGDIVIHLSNTGDKTSVRIGVTNPETEKLVTSQMESLKEMLRPLNTEVAEVYHNSQGAMDFSEFGRQMQDNRGQQPHTQYRYYGDDGMGETGDDYLAEAERMMAESRMSRLYAYV